MGAWLDEIWANNGAYLFAAYGIVYGGLIGYALWLRGKLATLRDLSREANGLRKEP